MTSRPVHSNRLVHMQVIAGVFVALLFAASAIGVAACASSSTTPPQAAAPSTPPTAATPPATPPADASARDGRGTRHSSDSTPAASGGHARAG